MLIFEPESFCIPAEESEVESVYRSSSPVFIGDDKSLPSCEAFVCIIHREQRHHVFAALHIGEIKRNLIYVVVPNAGELSSEDLSLGKALSFVKAMGFSMDPVNLKYGKAMREVVLRSIPVLFSPGNMERIRTENEDELSELNRVIAEAAEEPGGMAEVDPEKDAEKKRGREALKSAANAATRKLELEKCAAEKAASVGKSVQKFLLNANASDVAHAERAEYERTLREKAALEKRAAELAKNIGRIEKNAEIDRCEAERRIAELEAEVDKNLKETEAARSAHEAAALEKEAGEKRIADLEKALHKAGVELEAKKTLQKEWPGTKKALEEQIVKLERSLAEAKSKDGSPSPSAATLRTTEERVVQLEQEVSELREAADAERFERELLVREKAAALRRIEELEKEKTGDAGVAEKPGEYLSPEKEKRLAETENAAEQARCQLEAERNERERLEAERVLFEKRILKMEEELRKAAEKGNEARGKQLSEINAPTAELVFDLQKALQRAEERAEILRQEVERLAAVKASAEKRLEEAEPGSRKEAFPPGGETPVSSAGAKVIPPPPTVRRPPPKGAFFHVDWDLGSVEYDSPEDILEVHQSMNMAQLSLEGYHGQNCSAWIIALKKGKSRQVHVVFGLSESAMNLVYSPVKPVRNHDDYNKALSEAVKFLEVVGYLPEKVPLGGSPREQGRALKSIPVLQGPRKKVQGGSPMISTGSV